MPEALNGWEGWARAGFSPFAFYGVDKGGFLAADKGTATHAYFHIKGKVGSQDIFTQKLSGTCLINGNLQAFYGQRILGPHINIALV